MNKVILIGHVGETPRVKEFENGKMANFSFATTERGYTKKDGTQVAPETTWHRIVVNNSKLAENVEKYVNKGDLLSIEGKIKIREYNTKEGETRKAVEIYADEIAFLSPKKEGTQAKSNDDLPF